MTNGDYYVLFDRQKGLSLDQNVVGEFQLTHLTPEGMQVIERVRKEHILGI